MHLFFGLISGIFERIVGVLIVAFVVFALGAVASVGYGIYLICVGQTDAGIGGLILGGIVLAALFVALLDLADDD